MFDPAALAQLQADALTLRDDNPTSITIRRGATTLSAQTVRLLKRKGGSVSKSTDGKETRAPVQIVGAVTLDIAINDRFTVGALLYRVAYVQPDKRAATFAEAVIEA